MYVYVPIKAEALSSRELLSCLKDNGVAKVSQRTLQIELKRMGFIWKRTRYSLKKRDTERFEQTKADIAELIAPSASGGY